jgi:hypothetical protein
VIDLTGRRRSETEMTRFATFALLYMTALFLDFAAEWEYPVPTLGVLLLIILLLTIGITRVTFLFFLAATTSHFLLVQFPDVPNHVNLAIYCNILMMLGIAYSLVRVKDFPTDDEYFEMARPVLQATMVLVYTLSGFHKLNADFFNPDVSCVADMAGYLASMASSQVLGIPAGLVLVAGIGLVSSRLLSASRIRPPLPVVLPIATVCLTVFTALLTPRLAPGISTLQGSATLAMAVVVIAWELAGGIFLAIPLLQAPMLAFSWMMHSTLALIGFAHFSALALSLLFTFVPAPYFDLLNSRLRVPLIGRSVPRAYLYVAVNVLAGTADGPHRWLIAGLLFNVAALVLIWPLLSALVGQRPRPSWGGELLSSRLTRRWMFVFPALLLLHGLTPYLGLRTAGNFSMYSNLRTEGARSNHFLLAGNPLKLWDYQDDVVRFVRIDGRLQGKQLPVVEFRKRIYAWTKAGATIPMTFEYRGRNYSTGDIVNDPVWRTNARDWEMALMDFRVIQPSGPNRCRW